MYLGHSARPTVPFSCPAARTSKGTWVPGYSEKRGEDNVYTCKDYGFISGFREDYGFGAKTTINFNGGRISAQNKSN